jgi:hypothetical protein
MYSWSSVEVLDVNIDDTIKYLKKLNISSLYQAYYIKENNNEELKKIVSKIKSNGMEYYYLIGEVAYYKTPDAIKDAIDDVYEYNLSVLPEETIDGLVLDIEPYLDSEYKANIIKGFETYVTTIENVYEYAKSKDLKLVNVMTYWYDGYITNTSFTSEENAKADELLRRLIKSSTRISVMNYYKTAMTRLIETEVNYAKEYGVEVESIGEFSRPDGDSIPKTCSLWIEDKPIEYANTQWQKIYDTYNYEKLRIFISLFMSYIRNIWRI